MLFRNILSLIAVLTAAGVPAGCSTTARLTRLASSLADQAPPVDVARVAALRTAIAGGSYGVHPAIVASAMLDFHGGAD